MSVLDRFRLTDKVAMVTGAGKGIGAEIALAYADAGADVALLARTVSDLEQVAAGVEERGRRALIVPTDVMDLDALPPAVERTVADLGGIDILVNNAGGAVPAAFMDTRAEHMEWAFHFNVSGAALFLVSQASSWVTGKLIEVDGGWCFELLPRTIPDL